MGTFQVPARKDLVEKFYRDVSFRAPDVQNGDKTLVEIDANAIVDAVLPIFAKAQEYSAGTTLDGLTFDELQQTAEDEGLPRLLPAAGSTGFITIVASVGGTSIQQDDELVHKPTQKRYRALETRLYLDGDPVAVAAVDVGPGTDLDGGTILQWSAPRLGCGLNATVFTQSDGVGLYGGRAEETREELIARIRGAHGAPAASGNDASYQEAARRTPGVPVQAVFTHPAIQGPGTSCLLFTVRPSKLGGSRIPSNAAIGAVKGFVTGLMPRDDSMAYGFIIGIPTNVVLKIQWAQGIAKWTDGVPWPPAYVAPDQYLVHSVGTISPSSIPVTTSAGVPVAPQVGQTIALFDRANLRFVAKRILTVSGGPPWTITFDMSNGADQSYVPVAGDLISPWSDSLAQIPALVAAYFETLGSGEQVDLLLTSFFDDGYRERRSPSSPIQWPNSITSKLTRSIDALPAVASTLILAPAIPTDTPSGVRGVSSNLLELGQLAVFPG